MSPPPTKKKKKTSSIFVKTSVYQKQYHTRKLKLSQRMSKRKLWSPLSTALRRALPSTHHFPTYSASQFHSPTHHFSPSPPPPLISTTSSRSFSARDFEFLGNPKFPGKSFSSGTAEEPSVRCWSCGALAEAAVFLVCQSCRSVQPVDQSVDYFQIFGL
jgi:molecular chaperone HscB